MRKFLLSIIIILCVICGLYINSLRLIMAGHKETMAQRSEQYYAQVTKPSAPEIPLSTGPEIFYNVYIERKLDSTFPGYAAAVEYASGFKNASIYENHTDQWVWDNYPPYELNVNNVRIMYSTFENALEDAFQYDSAYISYKNSNTIIWRDNYEPEGSHFMEIPLIRQLPELPRGCEVTSLTMLLNYMGAEVDKITLSQEVAYHENNPYKGFVGDMHNIGRTGYGVYHGPIYELAHKYLPGAAIDMTGCEFDDLYYLLDNNRPVWIITNMSYGPLSAAGFSTLQTDEGPIPITYSEHSVLITGYDERYIYFNDPLERAERAEKTAFIAAWEQMGRQAVSVAEAI